ncbi:LysR family transcriptional regulator [soil metagenome]
MVNIKHLRVFVTVARTRSFAEAALALHLTSSALSAMVKGLEAELDFTVFQRTTRSVRLTPEGERLLPLAEAALDQHQAFLDAADTVRRHQAGLVRVATTQLLSCTILPPAISAFKALFPEVAVVQVPTLYDNFQELLVRKEVDFAVGPERLCDADIEATHLMSAPLYLVCSERNPLALSAAVPWSALSAEQVFLIDKRGASWLARDAGYQRTFERTLDVGHFSTALAMTAEGEGVMLAPDFTRKLLSPYALAMVPLTEPKAKRRFMVYRNVKASLPRDAGALMAHLMRYFEVQRTAA